MRILFIADNFPPEFNAPANRVYERACYWVKWGHDVTVITSAPNFPEGRVYAGYKNSWYHVEEMSGMRVVRVKTFISANKGVFLRTLDFMSFLFPSIAAGIFQKRPDVVMATSPQFFAAIAGWIISVLKYRPFIFELGDIWPASISAVGAIKHNLVLSLVEKLELFLYRRSAAVVALTHAFKENLINRGIDGKKIYVVVNGVDLYRYSPREKNETLLKEMGLKGKFIIGYIGTHGMAHALEKVLDAAELLKKDEDIRFLFIGNGASRDNLIAETKKRNLHNVIFKSAQPKDKMPEFLSLLDISLIHLKNDRFFTTVIPSKIFEAMGMGLPILLAGPENGEASKIVSANQAGVCIPSGSPKIFADTITELKNNPSLRKKLAQASYKAAPNYTREKQASEVIAVMQKITGKS